MSDRDQEDTFTEVRRCSFDDHPLGEGAECPYGPHSGASNDFIERVARTIHRADRYRIADDWDAMDDHGRGVYLDCARALDKDGFLSDGGAG